MCFFCQLLNLSQTGLKDIPMENKYWITMRPRWLKTAFSWSNIEQDEFFYFLSPWTMIKLDADLDHIQIEGGTLLPK